MAEQWCQAVRAVVSDGRTVTEVAAAVGVSQQSLHTWLATKLMEVSRAVSPSLTASGEPVPE